MTFTPAAPGFIPGETVNLRGAPVGFLPGIVIGIRYVPQIEVRWANPDGTPFGMTHFYSPEDLRHGE